MITVLDKLRAAESRSDKVHLLAELVDKLRPKTLASKDFSQAQLIALTSILQNNAIYADAVRNTLFSLVNSSSFVSLFTENGLPTATHFSKEVWSRARHYILPELQAECNADSVLHQLFHRSGDYEWVKAIDPKVWQNFILTITKDVDWVTPHVQNEIFASMQILSIRIASTALEKPIAVHLPADKVADVFSEQSVAVDKLIEAVKTNNHLETENAYRELKKQLRICKQYLARLAELRKINGTSIEQTFFSGRIYSQIKRLNLLASMLCNRQVFSKKKLNSFFIKTIENSTQRYSISKFISDNIGVLSYQIAEHKSKSGEHYITSTLAEYKDFFWASCKGGFIISLIVILKIFIHDFHAAPFWEAVLFSLNYAMGFILIHITHSALATKQPAMTASRIAASLDHKHGFVSSYQNLAEMVAQTSRSQLVSFAGNLLVVFPLPYLLSWLYLLITGNELISEQTATKMLKDIHPFESLAWLYAGFTGVFLFLSGIISGYWDNRVIYSKIPERIKAHPALQKRFSEEQLKKIAGFIEQNLGALIGNLSLGFFLGTAAFFGMILGLPYDIRHITIAAGNYAIGILGLHNNIELVPALICLVGVLGIGAINFLVSFSLAFYVAVRARGIHLRDFPGLIYAILNYFEKYPWRFFFPPKNIPSEK